MYIANYTLFLFHIYQAVPVFMVIAGVTLMITFRHDKPHASIRDFYSTVYFSKKVVRVICPFLIVFAASLLYGLWGHEYYIGPLSLLGLLPVSGPGNYYVTMLLEFVVIAPLLAYFYYKNRIVLLICMALLDLGFQLIAPHVGLFDGQSYLYRACILRYFSAIALGMLISDEYLGKGRVALVDRKYRLLILLLPFSIGYIILGFFSQQPFPFFKSEWGTQNIISFTYALVLTVTLLNLDITGYIDRIPGKLLTLLGKASYHIFLVQILFFGFNLTFANAGFVTKNGELFTGVLAILLNLTLTIAIGLIFFKLEPGFFSFVEGRLRSAAYMLSGNVKYL